MAGLTSLDHQVLETIREWYRALHARAFVGLLSFARAARRLDADPVHVRRAVERLLGLGLIAVKPGSGGRANTYLPILPRQIAKSTSILAADGVPPF